MPGKRNAAIILVFAYFAHNPEIAKLNKITRTRLIANKKYIIVY
ncbi:MAG: hypothetical protein JETT_3893 [Candidatus Jettenia ecosi]|uniref:Uncharacterized protein n=1 Tax=Candidatus Jettenia ecosi TaxID=2494326 RepID=A0A533Q5M8_9BACT|nr:MAG: hypothetical protein JETT_3893 [Candidatus Jettenia ecosi]